MSTEKLRKELEAPQVTIREAIRRVTFADVANQ